MESARRLVTVSIASSFFNHERTAYFGQPLKFLASSATGVIQAYMTISEIASQLRVALGVCVSAEKDVSSAERSYFAAVQNDSSDEEVISFWLSVSYLEDHRVPMFVAKKWAKKADNLIEWMTLLEQNTSPPENN
jgi:hypothetical protein